MIWKQKFIYVAVGCILTFICYCVMTLGTEIFNPQNAIAQSEHEIPTVDEIQADLLGRRIMTAKLVDWFDVYSMENFEYITIDGSKVYDHAVEFTLDAKFVNERYRLKLHVAYRKTDRGWELASVVNLRAL